MNDSVEKIVQILLESSPPPRIFTVSPEEFKEIYRRIREKHRDIYVDVIFNGFNAYAQFTQLNSHRLLITKTIKRGKDWQISQRFDAKEFPFLVNDNIYGQKALFTLRRFVYDELETNWKILLPSFLFLLPIYVLSLLAEYNVTVFR